MQKLTKSVATLVEEARRQIEEVDINQAMELWKNGDCIVVDIRDIRERSRDGFIPGSFHCPRGMVEFWVDPDSPYFKSVFAQETVYLFHCAVDWRSALTVATLNGMGFKGACHLKGGFSEWKKAGGQVARDNAQI